MPLEGLAQQLPEEVVAGRVFQSTVLAHLDSPAIKDAGDTTWITYRNLNQRVNQLARCLLKQLLAAPCSNPDGDRVVAVCMAPSTDLVIALFAIHKAGAAYLPLDVTFPVTRVQHILQDARPALVLAQGRPQVLNSPPVQESGVPVVHMEDLQAQLDGTDSEDLSVGEVGLNPSASSTAVILYTSGSTGVPKGVRVPHRAVMNRLAWQWHTFPYLEDEVCCFKTALTFVDSISEIFGPLFTGHRLVVVPKWMTVAVEELVSVMGSEGVGRLVLVPSLLRSILVHCGSLATPPLPKLRLWICSGEIFPPDLLQAFFTVFSSGQTICNFYGSTEVMGDVTYLQFTSGEEAEARLVDNKVPIGSPVTNCRIYLLEGPSSGAQVEVAAGGKGQIYAAGLNLAKGYVGGAQPDKFITNTHTTHPDYSTLYCTGDYGRVVGGVVVFEGRADSQIKIRGHRVDMSEVEVALTKVKGVEKVYVLCYKPGEVTQALVAFYTSKNGTLTPDLLKTEVAKLLQPYMVPQVVMVEDLPLLVNGKVDRQELLRMYENKTKGDLDRVAIDLAGVGSGDQEAARTLLLTVARVLGPALTTGDRTLDLDASFFHLGGNSLNSVLTITSLKDLGYSIGIGQFMKAGTLREVLAHLQKLPKDEPSGTCRRVTEEHGYNCFTLDHSHKQKIMALIGDSFAKKGDLESVLHTESWEYIDLLESMYDVLVQEQNSFVLTREGTGEVVACALNTDLRDEPTVHNASKKIDYILSFLEDCEAPSRSQLPEEVGSVLHSFMMGTLLTLEPAENVVLIQRMEEENLKIASQKRFKAVFTTNTSPLTQQVCDDLLSYKVLHDVKVNTWVASDGTRPFAAAPDDQCAVVTVKFL